MRFKWKDKIITDNAIMVLCFDWVSKLKKTVGQVKITCGLSLVLLAPIHCLQSASPQWRQVAMTKTCKFRPRQTNTYGWKVICGFREFEARARQNSLWESSGCCWSGADKVLSGWCNKLESCNEKGHVCVSVSQGCCVCLGPCTCLAYGFKTIIFWVLWILTLLFKSSWSSSYNLKIRPMWCVLLPAWSHGERMIFHCNDTAFIWKTH